MLIEHRVFQRDRQHLIGPARAIVSLFAIHDIIKVPALGVPKTAIERFLNAPRLIGKRFCFLLPLLFPHPLLHQPERIIPKPIDFDRFAAPRRHHPIIDFGIHPGELIARRSLAQ